jgi:hypothetical protein
MNNQICNINIWQVRVSEKVGCTWVYFQTNQVITSKLTKPEGKSIFTEKMDEDDIVVATDDDSKKILGIGVIRGKYYERSPDPESTYDPYIHTRSVNWEITESIKIETPIHSDGSSIYDIKEISSKDYEIIKNWYLERKIGLDFFK